MRRVQHLTGARTKREAVDLAMRELVAQHERLGIRWSRVTAHSLLAGAAAGQALALVAVVVIVRVVGPERAGLAPARRRGWLAASGGLLALVVTTAAIRGTLARRPRSRRRAPFSHSLALDISTKGCIGSR